MVNIELEQKMKEWADTFEGGKFKRFRDAPDSLKLFYVQHNMPLVVKDCVVEGKAQLTLMIAKQITRKSIKLCSECGRKVCDEDTCGHEAYEDRQPRAYIGADITGSIKVSVAPFKDNIEELEDDTVYVITGVIREFKKNLEINVEEVEKEGGTQETISPTESKEQPKPEPLSEGASSEEEAVEACKGALELFDGEVPESKWTQLTGAFDIRNVKSAMTILKIELNDGMYRIKK